MIKKSRGIVLRSKRQLTLPKGICDELGISPGDVMEVTIENAALVVRPKKTAAKEALREIQEAFRRSGITEEELQETGHRIREEIARERYASRA